MTNFNFLSKSSSQSCSHSSVTLASTVGSPSAHRRGTMLKLLSVLVLVLTFGVGNVWGANLQLTLSLTSNPGSWPTTDGHSTTSANATISGTSYSFGFTSSVYINSSYLMMKSGHALGLPAISGYKLITVVGTLNSAGNPSTASQVAIKTASSSGSEVTGGTAQTWNTKGGSKTYNLSGTAANTRYWMVVSNKNCQMTNLVLTYEPVSSCTNPSTLLSISSSNTATLGTDKTLTTSGGNNGTVTWTVANGTGSATIEGATLTPTSEGTVIVTATQDDNAGKCGKVVTQTITISKAAATITLSDANGTSSVSGTHYGGDSYTLPNTAATCTGKTLVGWSTVEIEEEGAKPTSNYYDKGTSATLAAGANTFYAVYAKATTTTEQNHSGPSFSRASSSNSYTSGYTFTTASSMGSDAAYYQDGQATTGQLKLYHTSTAIFSSTPTKVKLTAKIGGGTAKSLDTPVYAQLLNSSGTAIGNATAITSTITTATGDTYTDVELDLTGITSAYGVTIYHTKQSQYNVRYYSFSLSYTTGGTTYSNYATSCCTPLASINGSFLRYHFSDHFWPFWTNQQISVYFS